MSAERANDIFPLASWVITQISQFYMLIGQDKYYRRFWDGMPE